MTQHYAETTLMQERSIGTYQVEGTPVLANAI